MMDVSGGHHSASAPAIGRARRRPCAGTGTVRHIGRVLQAARAAKEPVFHCTMGRPRGRCGRRGRENCLMLAATMKSSGPPRPAAGSPVGAGERVAPAEERTTSSRPFRHLAVPRHGARSASPQPRRADGGADRVRIGERRGSSHGPSGGEAGYQVVIPAKPSPVYHDDLSEARSPMDNTLRYLADDRDRRTTCGGVEGGVVRRRLPLVGRPPGGRTEENGWFAARNPCEQI
jgi:hypothetical protein